MSSTSGARAGVLDLFVGRATPLRRVLILASLAVTLLTVSVAHAAAATLYAYPAATGSPAGCPAQTTQADGCSLSRAIGAAGAGDTIMLAGGETYVGNWTVLTQGTTATAPVTITADGGIATLDGNNGSATGCETSACNRPILTVGGNTVDQNGNTVHLNLSRLTITRANDTYAPTGFDSADGGGLRNDNHGVVTISQSTFTDNTATQNGGAIDNADNSAAFDSKTGTVTVTDSTFTHNSAGTRGGAIDNGDDGGTGTLTITGTTFSDNSASKGGAGGAIDNGDFGGHGTVTVTDSTFTNNRAPADVGTGGYGGAINNGGLGGNGNVTLTQSTLSGDSAANGNEIDSGDNQGSGTLAVAGDVFNGDCESFQTIDDGGYNVATNSDCEGAGPGDSVALSGSDLAALAGNGGFTETMALQGTSGSDPAIGLIPASTSVTLQGGSVSLCGSGRTDQRGYSRPGLGLSTCDAGAYETGQGPVLIGALRLIGLGGQLPDRYVELVNLNSKPVGLAGWFLNLSDGPHTQSIALPDTSIPANGHYLVADTGYNATLSDQAKEDDRVNFGPVARDGGVQLTDPSGAVEDAVGFQGAPTTSGTPYESGTPLTVPDTLPSGQFGWVRNTSDGVPVDTGDNASDFTFVSSTADSDGASTGSPVLGTSSPQDAASPVVHNDVLQAGLLGSDPNFAYAPGNGGPGTLTVYRAITNCSGQLATGACATAGAGTTASAVTRLDFRITKLSTVGNAHSGQAILEPQNGTVYTSGGCASPSGASTMPLDLANERGVGGLNSTWTATSKLPSGGLSAGNCLGVAFSFRVPQTGAFSFGYNAEDDLEPESSQPAPAPSPTTDTTTTPAAAAPDSSAPATAAPDSSAPATTVVSGVITSTGVKNVAVHTTAPATHKQVKKKHRPRRRKRVHRRKHRATAHRRKTKPKQHRITAAHGRLVVSRSKA